MSVSAKSILTNPVHCSAFGFGSGLAPKAPGTFGTIAAIPLYLLMSHLPLVAYLTIVLIACVVGIYLCGKTAKDLGVHDHPGIVWDEFAGFWITMIAIPPTFTNVLLGFVLFRIFDIWKPWPIGWADKKVDGGTGIMLDDVLAGLMALAVLQCYLHFIG